jgi:DNA adenine methylase
MATLTKPPLKWAGGKFRHVGLITELLNLNGCQMLIEPFVGAGSVFLNTSSQATIVADLNEALITFYIHLRDQGPKLIEHARSLFTEENNNQTAYNALRAKFNDLGTSAFERSALLLYLNKHCYNGLYRVNKDNMFNSPYGKPDYVPSFPLSALMSMWKRLATVKVYHEDFTTTMSWAGPGDKVYADPPYVPSGATADFTAYSSGGFSLEAHVLLEEAAVAAQRRGAAVLISNSDTTLTRELYRSATRIVSTSRTNAISRDGSGRGEVSEIMALYLP